MHFKSIEEILRRNLCCGCAACASVCPRKCIEIRQNSEGFWRAAIEHSQCINCGKCLTVCPMISRKKQLEETYPKFYGGWSGNQLFHSTSSSGGIFPELADLFLKENGAVVGVRVAANESYEIQHVIIEQTADIPLLQGSKYVQSHITPQLYESIEKILLQGRKVLFSGCPCQVSGAKRRFRGYDNFLTVDIICHGVPSPLWWSRYIQWKKTQLGNASHLQIEFRNKSRGWSKYGIRIAAASRDIPQYWAMHTQDPFMLSFLRSDCLGLSCYLCPYASLMRPGDLSLGDYWGVKKYYPELDEDDTGTSLVLVNNSRGQEIFERLTSSSHLVATTRESALPGNMVLGHAVEGSWARIHFYPDLQEHSFDKFIEKYRLCQSAESGNLFRKILRRLSHAISTRVFRLWLRNKTA